MSLPPLQHGSGPGALPGPIAEGRTGNGAVGSATAGGLSAPLWASAAPSGGGQVPPVGPSELDEANETMAELGAVLSSGEGSLDPESLVTIAESRLTDIDGQIGQVMTRLSENSQRVEDLSVSIQALQLIREALLGQDDVSEPSDSASLATVEIEWEGSLVRVSELLEQLGIDGLTTSDTTIRLGVLDERINALKTESSRLNSGNEMEMIRLQTLMSQRSQVIELATRMISSLNESQMAIIRNMGR